MASSGILPDSEESEVHEDFMMKPLVVALVIALSGVALVAQVTEAEHWREVQEPTAPAKRHANSPLPLRVAGARIVNSQGQPVRLAG